MATGTGLAPRKTLFNLMTADPFRTFPRSFDTWLQNAFGPLADREELTLGAWTPSCDIFETKDNIVLKVELPGLKKEDVKVNLENGVLSIRGERKLEEETKRENYYRMERQYGEFSRTFTIPGMVDVAHIMAEFKDGILKVTLPKHEEAKPKAVEVAVK